MIFKSMFVGRLTVFIALVVSVVFLFSYCIYQVSQPMIHQRRIEYARQKYLISQFLEHVQKKGFERILSFAGSPSEDVLRRLFQYVDENGDKLISRSELRALIIGMHIEDAELDGDAATDRLLNAFNLSRDGSIDLNEFVSVMMKWLEQAETLKSRSGRYSGRFIEAFREKSREEYESLLQETEETEESTEDHAWIIFNSVLFLVFGTVIAAVFADPLVDAVHNFSNATNIPSFFISFIAMPLATNSSEAVSSIIFAGRKKKRTASLTFSQIYGAATMNNTLCLSIFLALVYIRDINWDFSSEVLVILLVCVVMGLFASFRTTFQLWTSSVAFLLYPFSLILVYVLDNIFGWS